MGQAFLMINDSRCEICFTRPVLSVVEGYERRNTNDEIGLVLSFFVTIGISQALFMIELVKGGR